MGLRSSTEDAKTVLYDSVNGRPLLGIPVFDSQEEADDFVEYHDRERGRGYSDLCSLRASALTRLHGEWAHHREMTREARRVAGQAE